MQVVLGEHDISVTTETVTVRSAVLEIISHPDYNLLSSDLDFALLRLANPINFEAVSNIRPICLPADASQTYAGNSATITGWGTLEFLGSFPTKLQEVNVTVLTNEDCRTDTAYSSSDITDNMVCAGDTVNGGKDSCQGDSGLTMI